MYSILRPILFRCNAETSHNLAMAGLSIASKSRALTKLTGAALGAESPIRPDKDRSVQVMGITFPNPVGLAAGLDKEGAACNALHQLGFGWLELGTVTPVPQPGNPKPRMFRLTEHSAIINRMGFNSSGLDKFISNIKQADPTIIKGINIGKNAATPLNKSAEDYLIGLRSVYDFADYVAINISSPNTKNLRDLQQEELLNALLNELNQERNALSDTHGKNVPLVLKISPDIDQSQIDSIADLVRKHDIDGIAATNTTIKRDTLEAHPLAKETGGLSGPPVSDSSTKVIAKLNSNLQGEVPIIGIGGINDAQSAMEKFNAGASLIQLYTGFIYKGPKLIKKILDHL